MSNTVTSGNRFLCGQFTVSGCCILGCLLSPGIAALVIAGAYDEDSSPCKDQDFLIDLVTYLDVAGALPIALFGLTCLISIALWLSMEAPSMNSAKELFMKLKTLIGV